MEELIMSDVVAVTNRHLCVRDYFEQIEVVASSGVNKIIVREKDLAPQEYKELFVRVRDICSVHKVKAIPHYFWREAAQCGSGAIHLPLDVLGECYDKPEFRQCRFDTIGTSVHSAEQALEACRFGASYVTAGHVFATDCKKGSHRVDWISLRIYAAYVFQRECRCMLLAAYLLIITGVHLMPGHRQCV